MGMDKKVMKIRNEALSFALKIVQEKGVEELEKEVKMRGVADIPFKITRKDIEEVSESIKNNVFESVQIMSLLVLKDEFGFGNKRLARFMDRFKLKTEWLLAQFEKIE